MGATKIATCCYCGTKAALVLRGKKQHELSCGNCGAPLRAMKMLPTSPERASRPAAKKQSKYVPERPKKRRKRKSFGKRMMSEIWDVLEDVVDEVFD